MPTTLDSNVGQSVGRINPSDDKSILAFVEQRWEARSRERGKLEKQWYENIAHFQGDQNSYYDPSSGVLRTPKMPAWRVRLVINRLQPVVRKIVSKALRQQPLWTSIPATGDLEDQQVSIVSSKVLEYFWRTLDMDRKLVDAFYWMATTGNVFMSMTWDPSKGSELSLSEDDRADVESRLLAEGLGSITSIRRKIANLRLGDLRCDVHSPFAIDVDPSATTLQDGGFLIDSTAIPLDTAIDRYGEKAKGLLPDAGSDGSTSMHFRSKASSYSLGTTAKQDSVVVHKLFVDPTPRMQRGFYAVVAGGKVMEKLKEIPNPFRKKPYVHWGEIPIPGQLWHTCALRTAMPIQASYNRTRSQLVENANLMGRPKWLNPRGSGVKQSNFNSSPGEVIEHTPGLQPSMIEVKPLPQYINENLNLDIRDMDDVTAIHEVTQAKAGGGARSGIAIAQLQEQDDQMLAPTFMLASHEIARLGSWALHLVAENVDEDRLIKLVGKDKKIEAMTFSGQSLFGPNKDKNGVNYFDVEVQLGSQLPMSKAARLQFVIDLVSNGLLDATPGGPDRARIFKMLEIGSDEGVLQEDALDRQNATRANLSMMEGRQVPVYPWDDPNVHLEELRRFQKMPEFLQSADDAARGAFELRARELEFKVQEQQEALPPEDLEGHPPQTTIPPPEAEAPQTEEEAIALLAQQEGLTPPGTDAGIQF